MTTANSDCRPECYIVGDPDETRPHSQVLDDSDLPPFVPSEGPLAITAETLAKGAGDTDGKEHLRKQLADRAFNFALAPLPPYPILSIGDRVISTPGNLTSVQGPVKSGKTGVLEAILAAVFNGKRQGPDTLGFSAENIHGKAVIHFDTEQSRYDHDALIRRALRRAQVASPPPWFCSYNVTDLTVVQRREALEVAIEDASAAHGGVFLIVIDGIADLCASPNDEEEAYGLVGRLHALAITHDCVILCVLHENPGSENGKMRGHLGSQLERKAETPLRLAKDAASGVTTIWADRARHCHLPRENGVCFAWSDEAKMHVSVGTVREIKASAKVAKFRGEAETAFGDEASLSYSDLVGKLVETALISNKTAERRVKQLTIEGIVTKTVNGTYILNP